ncbi:sulfotransferase family protein [Shewanella sp. AS16]|uniref:sulfotransferase family protein n=1 Tax=Shewanella sp. AS16 TaxID=2907625 RepID=UPI003FA3D2E5
MGYTPASRQADTDSNPSMSNTPSQPEPQAQGGKIFILGLPRTGTTSISVALLEAGFKVAHMAFTKRAFELADAVADTPCFSDYRQLDALFPGARFVYLEREISGWLASMQMLLGKMLPHLDEKTGYFHPVLKRSFRHTFGVGRVADPRDSEHLTNCYQIHRQEVLAYFDGRQDFLRLDISRQGSLGTLLQFLGLAAEANESTDGVQELNFPKLNVGRDVAGWGEYKHPNKINANSAGPQSRKFFDYKLEERSA